MYTHIHHIHKLAIHKSTEQECVFNLIVRYVCVCMFLNKSMAIASLEIRSMRIEEKKHEIK